MKKEKKMKKAYEKIAIAAVVAMLAGMVATDADALQLKITDLVSGDTTDWLYDTDGDGILGYTGPVGSWTVHNAGLSYPFIGDGVAPEMDLVSFEATTNNSESNQLEVSLIDYFGPYAFGLLSAIGGTINGAGTVTYQVYVDGSLVSTIIGTGAAFSGTDAFWESFGPGSELEMRATIDMDGRGYLSFDANVAPVPEPATIMLMGSGLVALAGYGRRRMKKAEDVA